MWEYESINYGPGQLCSQSSPGDLHTMYLAEVEGQRDKFGQNGKLGHSCARVTKGKFSEFQVKDHVMHLRTYVCTYCRHKSKQLRP